MKRQLDLLMARGAWKQLRENIPNWLRAATGEAKLHLHEAMVHTLLQTAQDESDQQNALRHALICLKLAGEGSLAQAVALYHIATISARLGRMSEARAYGERFLRAAEAHPSLAPEIAEVRSLIAPGPYM